MRARVNNYTANNGAIITEEEGYTLREELLSIENKARTMRQSLGGIVGQRSARRVKAIRKFRSKEMKKMSDCVSAFMFDKGTLPAVEPIPILHQDTTARIMDAVRSANNRISVVESLVNEASVWRRRRRSNKRRKHSNVQHSEAQSRRQTRYSPPINNGEERVRTMQSHEAAKLPYVFKPHIFEGQSLRSPFKRFHYDSRIYSLKVLEASVGKHLFCRKRGGCQLLQDGEIKRKIQNLSLRADDQIAVLTSIFNTFLKCRMRRDDSRLRKYICFQLKVLLSFTCGKHELFDPVHLFKIVECLCKLDYGSFHAACSKHYSYDSSGHLNLRRENVLDFERIGLKQISFFGELLYCCASVDKKFNSLFVILTKPLTKKQSELVNEISTVITPNLSLLVFIALRNWIIYYRPFWDWELTNFDRSCPDKKLKQFKDHFSTFLMCKISGPNSFSYTTSYASSIFQFLKNKYFKDNSFQVEYFDHIPDVMLEKEYYHDRTGKNIPELFALSNILDFIIVDSWPRDPPIDYFRICKEIERNVDHNTQMRDYCIFPFVGLNNR